MDSPGHTALAYFAMATRRHGRGVLLAMVILGPFAIPLPAEIVFQDFFNGVATNITNSVPALDVQGNGWQPTTIPTQLALDGNGHIYNAAASAGTAAGVQLNPIGPHGSMTASATIQLPAGSTEWIGMGFAGTNQFLTGTASGSGPWIQVAGTGTVTFYGGVALTNSIATVNAFTNQGSPIQIFLAYDAFQSVASVGTVASGVTNLILNQWPVTNTVGSINPKYLEFQFSTNLTTATARWVTAAAVDWLPRPSPMLTLPQPVQQTNLVGSPGANDIQLIQNAFNLVNGSSQPTEIRFTAGATYVITNSSLVSDLPVTLLQATNVVVNGNGCKILITNPRIGFLNVSTCSNVIVEGFSVDYNPLPYTQGVVTHNFFTGGDTPKQPAIEFQVNAGYPAPTNSNYLDPAASGHWGTVMDPTRPGREADAAYTICVYTNVVQTNSNGAFKVLLPFSGQAVSIQPGDLWCMISRWNGSMVFNSYQSSRVTWLDNTNYTGAGPSYVGTYSSQVCEINDQILLGPPPAGATAPRLRTSNADGGLFIESRIGPWVQGCSFTGLSDDVANAAVNPFVVTNVPAKPTNTFNVYGFNGTGGLPNLLVPFQAEIGDSVIFYNSTNGMIFDRATITNISLPQISFDHPITNVAPGTTVTNTLLFDLSLNTSAVYLDNQFSNSRIHGIYCRANNMLIAHNQITGMGSSAIAAFPAMTLNVPNSFVPTNVVIMDNLLSDCSFSQQALSNNIPTQEPNYALIELHKAEMNSDYVTNGLEISGIRILYNAFLNWRRAPLTLHNATDVNIIGNYFGPPLTNDGYVPLARDTIADLWASDYPNIRFTNNVNATTLTGNAAINEDGNIVAASTAAFESPTAPQLVATRSGSNVLVSWNSAAPGFVLRQKNTLKDLPWTDIPNLPFWTGTSNTVTIPIATTTNCFFQALQR